MFNFPIPNGTAQNIYASKPRQTGAYILTEYVNGTFWTYTANPENYANNSKYKFWKTPDHMNVED